MGTLLDVELTMPQHGKTKRFAQKINAVGNAERANLAVTGLRTNHEWSRSDVYEIGLAGKACWLLPAGESFIS
jgi:hypothetical protein